MKKKPVLSLLFLAGMAWPGWACAQSSVSGLGAQQAPWLDLANSARYEALGGAGVAVADDVNALQVNPAGLGQLKTNEASAMYNALFQGMGLAQGEVALKAGPGSLGLALNYLNLGSLNTVTVSGGLPVVGGPIQSSAWIGQVAYGLEAVQGWYFGASAKVLQDDLAPGDSQTGFSGDLGVLWAVPGTGLKAGTSVLNVGTFDSGPTPGEWDLGLSYQGKFDANNQYLVTGQGSTFLNQFGTGWLGLGVEYSWMDTLAVRAGQRFQNTAAGLSGWSGFSAGAGVKYQKLELDYAFATQGDLGNFNMVSLLVHF
jgi:hypothetical protein